MKEKHTGLAKVTKIFDFTEKLETNIGGSVLIQGHVDKSDTLFVFRKNEYKASLEYFSVTLELTKQNTWPKLFLSIYLSK